MTYPNLKMLIAGQWTDGTSGLFEDVYRPADGKATAPCKQVRP